MLVTCNLLQRKISVTLAPCVYAFKALTSCPTSHINRWWFLVFGGIVFLPFKYMQYYWLFPRKLSAAKIDIFTGFKWWKNSVVNFRNRHCHRLTPQSETRDSPIASWRQVETFHFGIQLFRMDNCMREKVILFNFFRWMMRFGRRHEPNMFT